jgi:hypothetical protein
MTREGDLIELREWGFQFKQCDPAPGPQATCRFLSLGEERIRLPAAANIQALIETKHPGSNLAVGEHIFSEGARDWLSKKGSSIVSIAIPHSVQRLVTVEIGNQKQRIYGIGVHAHIQSRASDLLASGGLKAEYDFANIPWFGPPDLPPALVTPSKVSDYLSLRERQIGTSNLANFIHIGFPLLVAAVAIVLDHSLAVFLLSIVGASQALRSFISYLINAQVLAGDSAKLMLLASNGLAAGCLLLLALELAGHKKVTALQRSVIVAAMVLFGLALFPLDVTIYLKADHIFDFASAALSAAILVHALGSNFASRVPGRRLPTMTAFDYTDTELPLRTIKLVLAIAGLSVYAMANLQDLLAVERNSFKDFLDWQHLVLFPVLIAACLIDVGSTSRKMFVFAQEMVKKAIIDRELELGREIQQKMLPKRNSSGAGFSWRSTYLPASALAGDWYDIRELVFSDGKKMLVACLADVTGHGAGAALSTGVISAQWGLWCQDVSDQAAPKSDQEKNTLLCKAPWQINRGLLALRSNENCTAIFLMLDLSSEKLTHCSAGHPGALLSDGSSISYLMGRGDRLGGGRGEESWSAQTTDFGPSKYVIIFSDGVVPIGKTVSSWIAGLGRQIRKQDSEHLGTIIARQVRENRQEFRKNTRSEDDITIVAIGHTPRTSHPSHAESLAEKASA